MTILERIEKSSIPEPNTGCWIWTKSFNKQGYGWGHFRGKNRYAHRVVMMETQTGWDIPRSVMALHRCDNPACVNPDHIYPGDASQNAKDAVQRGLNKNSRLTHCKYGHEFSEENTERRSVAGKWNRRTCIECRRRRHKETYRRHRRAIIDKAMAYYRKKRGLPCQ